MFSKKLVSPIIKFKQIYVLFMLMVSAIGLQGQPRFELDSLQSAKVDSIQKRAGVRDSLNYQYVVVDPSAPNYYLDSMRALVVVEGNNFVKWLDNMSKLKKQDVLTAQMPLTIKSERPTWILLVVLVLFIAIGLVRLFFYNNFYNIIYGFYNDRILAQINKEDSLGTSWPYIFLYIIFTLSLGLFITIYRSYILYYGDLKFVYFLNISVGIALLFIIKIIFVRIVGILFDVERLVREYIVFLYLFYFNSVLILMPLLLMVTFMPSSYFNFIIILFIAVVTILFLYRFLKTLSTLIGNLRFSIFYLILYLCTLEIAPILILVKSLNN